MLQIHPNFLSDKWLGKLLSGIDNMNADWLFKAVKTNQAEHPVYTKNNPFGMMESIKSEIAIKRSLQEKAFTYKFSRTTPHHESCSCFFCDFKENLLDTTNFKRFIKAKMELENDLYLYETFISVYEPGDFLSAHTDATRGVAFIFNLTPDWRPEYGGCLTVKQEDKLVVYPPTFNSLTLMGLENGQGITHYVSEVSKYAHRPRIAITGWFNEKEPNE